MKNFPTSQALEGTPASGQGHVTLANGTCVKCGQTVAWPVRVPCT